VARRRLGVDDYDATNIHTVGLRASGMVAGFDLNAEAAYQWGDAGQVGFIFKPFLYGDDGAEYSNWAGTVEAGYTFDVKWQPRVFLGFDYYGGETTATSVCSIGCGPSTSPRRASASTACSPTPCAAGSSISTTTSRTCGSAAAA
jgi:hypothetical protein